MYICIIQLLKKEKGEFKIHLFEIEKIISKTLKGNYFSHPPFPICDHLPISR